MSEGEDDQRLFKQELKAREMLQAIEDALVEAGYDDFVVKTERGSFRWQTTERAREDAASAACKRDQAKGQGRATMAAPLIL